MTTDTLGWFLVGVTAGFPLYLYSPSAQRGKPRLWRLLLLASACGLTAAIAHVAIS